MLTICHLVFLLLLTRSMFWYSADDLISLIRLSLLCFWKMTSLRRRLRPYSGLFSSCAYSYGFSYVSCFYFFFHCVLFSLLFFSSFRLLLTTSFSFCADAVTASCHADVLVDVFSYALIRLGAIDSIGFLQENSSDCATQVEVGQHCLAVKIWVVKLLYHSG